MSGFRLIVVCVGILVDCGLCLDLMVDGFLTVYDGL